MSWLLPSVQLPTGGRIRSEGRYDHLAYQRAYYHAKRKPVRRAYTTAQAAKRKAQRHALYHNNLERERANARARYWKYKAREK